MPVSSEPFGVDAKSEMEKSLEWLSGIYQEVWDTVSSLEFIYDLFIHVTLIWVVYKLLCKVKNNSHEINDTVSEEKNKMLLRQVNEMGTKHEKLHATIMDLRESLQKTRKEKENALMRLSKALGDNLVHSNPNIADLSDFYRPTKIAEMFNELYDNEWTSAFSAMNDRGVDEFNCVRILLQIVMRSHVFCHAEVHQSIVKICGNDKDVMAEVFKNLKQWNGKARTLLYKNFLELCTEGLNEYQPGLPTLNGVSDFIQESFRLSWFMALQDPPMIFRFTPGNGNDVEHPRGMKFSRDFYREYTRRGDYVHFIVWPILLLHENGPLLSKGVAEGCTYETSRATPQ